MASVYPHAHGFETHRGSITSRFDCGVAAPAAASSLAAVSTEIHLDNVCSWQEILRFSGRGQGTAGSQEGAAAAGGGAGIGGVVVEEAEEDEDFEVAVRPFRRPF
eukprot:COSAG01_NODE_2533_length_7491_cov_236.560741_9_plen_105_part_00